jgi:tetratricopeptide (TPR) repeat protein
MRHDDEQQATNEGEDGECGGSVASCRREVGRDPRSADAHIRLGGALFDAGDNVGAISSYDQAIKINPNIAFVHSNRGDALRLTGDLEGAIAACTSAIRIDPKDASAYLNLGAALATAKDLSGAAVAFQQAIQLEPNSGLAHANLGNCQLESGDLERAIVTLERASELDPRDPFALHNLGTVLAAGTSPARAAAAFKKAISLPESRHVSKAKLHRSLAEVLTDQGDHKGAIAAYRQLTFALPTSGRAHYDLGNALETAGDLGAEEAFKRADSLDCDSFPLPKRFRRGHLVPPGPEEPTSGSLGTAHDELMEIVRRAAERQRQLQSRVGPTIPLPPEDCCICFDQMLPGNSRLLDCGHSFHSVCIAKHLETGMNDCCPLCRKQMAPDPQYFVTKAIGISGYALILDSVAVNSEHFGTKGSRGSFRNNATISLPVHHVTGQEPLEETASMYKDAATLLKYALGENPALNGWNTLGIVLEKTGDVQGALSAYKSAIALNAESQAIQAWSCLGAVLGETGDIAGALDAHSRVVKMDPLSAQAHANLGQSRVFAGDITGAAESFKMALARDGTMIFARQGLDRAVRYLEQARSAKQHKPPLQDFFYIPPQGTANFAFPEDQCAKCNAKNVKLLRCGSCRAAWYCCRDHQRAHWREHKSACCQKEQQQQLRDQVEQRKLQKKQQRKAREDAGGD